MKITATTKDAYNLVHSGALALARAERQGIRIDMDYCERETRKLTRRITRYEQRLMDSKLYRRWRHIYGAKTNLSSNHQLSQVLYKAMKLTPKKTTTKGKDSTDEDSLKQLGLPELDMLLQIRKLYKVRDTYLKAFMRENHDGYIHPNFNLHLVRTHRSSSDRPNFQNIPKRDKEAMQICRRALYPRPGHMLVEADFSALEVNISACYHKDPTMIQYLSDKDADMHTDMAKQVFLLDTFDKSLPEHNLLRQATKNGFVFPQFYGDYYANNAAGLCEWTKLPQRSWKQDDGVLLPDGQPLGAHLRKAGIRSFNQFTEHMKAVEDDFWNRRFGVYNTWKNAWVEQYRRQGSLQMLTGFVCSGVMRRNEIINYPIQGAAFHCLLWTFVRLDQVMQAEKWDTKLIGQIHDSIVMDVLPEELDHVKKTLHRIVSVELPAAWKWIIVNLEIDTDEYGVDGPWVS